MASNRAIQRKRSRPAPATHGLGTDAEECGNLGGGKELVRFGLGEKPSRQVLLIRTIEMHMRTLIPEGQL